MLNIFKRIKDRIMKKEELEQQLAEAIAIAQRLGDENKRLKIENDSLFSSNKQLKEDFDSAVDRVRYLDGQVRMLELQKQSAKKYSDSDRNY